MIKAAGNRRACRLFDSVSPNNTDSPAIILQYRGNSIATRQTTAKSYNGKKKQIPAFVIDQVDRFLNQNIASCLTWVGTLNPGRNRKRS
jgi:hypothetical protein